MEAGRTCGYRDDSLPALSLGLSSVRLIVNKFESQYTRVIASDTRDRELVKYDPNVDEGYDDCYDSPLERSRRQVWDRFVASLGLAVTRCIPSVTFGNFGVLAVTTGLFAPRMISYLVLYPFCRLVFGTLYPAYASYKAVRTKNLKEYVKWMMYWIVFALFTCTETFTDVFLSWFPFYYEVKIVLVLWLLSPATKGSSILYRKFVHPALCRREQEIDEYIAKAKDQGYHTVLNLGTKGVNYATTVIMQTAIKGGGGLVQQLRKSYSLSDLTECSPREERGGDEADDVLAEPLVLRRAVKAGYVTRRSASESNSRSPIYFPEVDVDVRPRPRSDEPDFSHIKSTEDISSGYSSADNSASLTRTASLGAGARRTRATRSTTVTAIKRPQAAEESEVIIEELRDDDNVEYANMPPLVNVPSPIYLSHTEPPFLYQYVGDQVKILQVLGDFPLSELSKNKDQKSKNDDKNIENQNVTENDSKNIDSNIPANDKEIESSAEIESSKKTEIPYIDKDLSKETEIKNETAPEIESSSKIETPNTDKDQSTESKEESIPNIIIQKDIAKDPITTKENKDIITIEPTSLVDTSLDDNDSAESDDEASFGTPDNSPKSKRKSSKGRYGKSKAPLPPNIDLPAKDDKKTETDNLESATSQESLVDMVNKLPKAAFKETGNFKGLQVVNPIAEKKRRHKSKSPGLIAKTSTSGLGRLLQLPGRLAFWHKGDDKTSDVSNSSSRRSSNHEQAIDEFQSCNDLTKVSLTSEVASDDQLSHQDASDYDTESISQEIIEKSDALQKTIEAKLESHPEYKTGALDEILTTSKSTDV